jgi:hypothetical protein
LISAVSKPNEPLSSATRSVRTGPSAPVVLHEGRWSLSKLAPGRGLQPFTLQAKVTSRCSYLMTIFTASSLYSGVNSRRVLAIVNILSCEVSTQRGQGQCYYQRRRLRTSIAGISDGLRGQSTTGRTLCGVMCSCSCSLSMDSARMVSPSAAGGRRSSSAQI